MKQTKTQKRVDWLKEHKTQLDTASKKYECPNNCRSKCRNGATCFLSSDGGWGYWVWACKASNISCEPMDYWSGSNPTPSTSINKGIAEYISQNAPQELM